MDKLGTVLITGASSGIGYELSKEFARQGYNLVLVARSEGRLQELAKELTESHGVKIYIIQKDLSLQNSAVEVFNEVQQLGLQVDILVNNAGFGYVGLFHEKDFNEDFEMIQVNVTALTELTKLFSKEMISRGYGKILNVASTGSFHPGPYTAVYYATKAYVLSFSEAIYEELKPYNITVTALCPGATRTNFSKRAGKRDNKAAMEPEVVAKIAYRALKKNKRVVVPGVTNRMLVSLPRNLVREMVGRYQKRLSEK